MSWFKNVQNTTYIPISYPIIIQYKTYVPTIPYHKIPFLP